MQLILRNCMFRVNRQRNRISWQIVTCALTYIATRLPRCIPIVRRARSEDCRIRDARETFGRDEQELRLTHDVFQHGIALRGADLGARRRIVAFLLIRHAAIVHDVPQGGRVGCMRRKADRCEDSRYATGECAGTTQRMPLALSRN
jgi:hypothetical protein